MKKVILFTMSIFLFSCTSESINEENLEAVNFNGPIIQECEGYGIFENELYDCGWKRGYEDWVSQYNAVANEKDDANCIKFKIKVISSGGKIKASLITTEKGTQKSIFLIPETKNRNQYYYSNLYNNSNGGALDQGKIAGYEAGRGQQPYAELPELCD